MPPDRKSEGHSTTAVRRGRSEMKQGANTASRVCDVGELSPTHKVSTNNESSSYADKGNRRKYSKLKNTLTPGLSANVHDEGTLLSKVQTERHEPEEETEIVGEQAGTKEGKYDGCNWSDNNGEDVVSGNSSNSDGEEEVQLKPPREKIKELLSSDGSMNVRTRDGYMIRIENVYSDYERDRPKHFDSPRAEWMWDTGTYINMRRLKTEIKINDYVPDDAVVLVDKEPLGPVNESIEERKEKVNKIQKSKVNCLSDELRVMKTINAIRSKIPLHNPKLDEALQLMDSLFSMDVTTLMILKNPCIINTAQFLCNYQGLRHGKYLTEDEKLKILTVRKLAGKLVKKFEALFCVPKNTPFATYFKNRVALFWKIYKYDRKKIMRVTTLPFHCV